MAAACFSELEILLIDDEEFCRSVVARLLKTLSVSRINHAADGFEGIQKLRHPGRADIVILDHNMPRLSGLAMLKKIREGSAGLDRDQPVAMLTGHGDLEIVEAARALDVNDFLVKPVSAAVLAGRLDRILNERVAIRAAAYYGEVQIPATIRLSSDVRRDQSARWRAASEDLQPIELQLENIPVNATLVEEVYGPDGDVLLPAGIRLTPRLLSRLAVLRGLDDCVARLIVDIAVSGDQAFARG
jgi:CheY-like chemotaxis protein